MTSCASWLIRPLQAAQALAPQANDPPESQLTAAW